MSDREKLIELIGLTEYGNGALVGKNFQRGFIGKIADHLLANGVTVSTDNNECCKAQEILDKWEFFYGQRAGRELWHEKPTSVQVADIEQFNRDIRIVRAALSEKSSDAQDVSFDEWIPVSVRLPEDEKQVLAYIGYEDSMIGFIASLTYFAHDTEPHWQHQGLLRDGQSVICWMPMPKPPKGEQE